MGRVDKGIIRYLICLWMLLSVGLYIQYFFQKRAIKENSLVIALSNLNSLQEFNYSNDLFEARCIYKYSIFNNSTFVCPVNTLTESIQFQIQETATLRVRKVVLDYCTKRQSMIGHLQRLQNYVIEKDIISHDIDIFYFRDVAFLLYDYIDAIKEVSKIDKNVSIEPC